MLPRNNIILGVLVVVMIVGTVVWYWNGVSHTTTEQEIGSHTPLEGCMWKKLEEQNQKFSLLVESCQEHARPFVLDAKGAVRSTTYWNGDVTKERVIELFSKGEKETPAQVLQRQFVAKLTDPYERAHCVPIHMLDKDMPADQFTKTIWKIQPDTDYMAKIIKGANGGIPADACINAAGNYGYYFDSSAYFEFHADSPEQFVWVIIGQEDPGFDEQSIEF